MTRAWPRKCVPGALLPANSCQSEFEPWDRRLDTAVVGCSTHLTPRNRSKRRELPNVVLPAEAGQFGLVNLHIAEMEHVTHGGPFNYARGANQKRADFEEGSSCCKDAWLTAVRAMAI